MPFNQANSSGFQTNESSTWDLIGPYELDAVELELGYTGNGLYGFDTVVLENSSSTVNQTKQVVASVPDLDFWLGVVGLGPKSINFTTFNQPLSSYLSDLVANDTIPSLSWGYTAGAHYRNETPASLTLGGYDVNRFEATNLTIAMNADNSRPLQVGVQKIIAENTLGGSAVNVLPTATYHLIDSTVPHIWLPDDAVDSFVANFGLTYDNNTDLFLINDTMRQRMLTLNPTITFVLGSSSESGSGGNTQNIQLPYAAFDLQASYPFYQNATNYFPIRRAANSTQYTIGRTFLQEAYLIADFDRGNFTVAQTSFSDLAVQQLVAIQRPVASNSSTNSTSAGKSNAVTGGEIAGIVVGAVAGLTAIGLLVWYFLRRSKRTHARLATTEPVDTETVFPAEKKDSMSYNYRGSELPSENGLVEASDKNRDPSELPSNTGLLGSEMEGDMGRLRGRPGMVEAAGDEQRRFELPGSEPEPRIAGR